MNEERDARICARYKEIVLLRSDGRRAADDLRDIGHEFGVCAERVRQILRQNNVTQVKANINRNIRICDMYRSGKTISEIGDIILLSVESVRLILKKNGIITCRLPGRDFKRDVWSVDEDELLLKLVGNGWALAHIALEMGKTREAVKGRSWRLRNAKPGEALPKYSATGYVRKLTLEQRAEIRASCAPHTTLARRYGVTFSTIAAIRNMPEWMDEPGRCAWRQRPSFHKKPDTPTAANLRHADGRKTRYLPPEEQPR